MKKIGLDDLRKTSWARRFPGFTLAELIVVITILAILATVGFIALSGYSQDAKNSAVATNVRSLYTAITAESAVTGNSPRYYVIHDDEASLSWGIVVFDGKSTTLTWGEWNVPNTNYSAGNPDYVKLKLNKDKFRISSRMFESVFAAYDKNALTVGATDVTVATGNKTRTNGFVQVAWIGPETKKASVMGNFPSLWSGSVAGLVKDPASPNSTGALVDGNASVIPTCAWGMVWNGSACAVPPYAFSYAVSTNANNYDVRAAAVAAGWDQIKPLAVTVTVNAGVTLGSTSSTVPALTATGSFPTGSTFTLVNNGSILGKWGNGGYGGTWNWSPSPGEAGGTAIVLNLATTIQNNGTIAWGGGGGGGGGGGSPDCSSYCVWGGGGGGGAWSSVWSAGGWHPCGWYPGASWAAGWPTVGWNWGNGAASNGSNIAGKGGNGWALGSPWSWWVNAVTQCSPTAWAVGWAAWKSVVGHSFAAWLVNGTILWPTN